MGRITAMLAATAVACALAPTSALATTAYPAGADFQLDNARSTLSGGVLGVVISCTGLSGGTISVPAAPGNSATGALTVPLTTLPSWSGCTNNLIGGPTTRVVPSGSWSYTLNYGIPSQGTLNIPARGLTILITDPSGATTLETGVITSAAAITGTFSNGIVTPLVNSSWGGSGSASSSWSGSLGTQTATTSIAIAGRTLSPLGGGTSPLLVGP